MRNFGGYFFRAAIWGLGLVSYSLYADYLSPFWDCPVGTIVSSVATLSKGDLSGEYALSFQTDTGPQKLQAVVAKKMQIQRHFGRPVLIKAKILEVAPRKLEVLEVHEMGEDRKATPGCTVPIKANDGA